MPKNLNSCLARNLKCSLLVGSFILAVPVHADAERTTIPMTDESFDFEDGSAFDFREIHGQTALCLDGAVLLKDLQMSTGTVRVEIENSATRHFANILFHATDFENTEATYLRMHKSGSPDAVQYTPYTNGESNWQLLGTEQFAANFGDGDWVALDVSFDEQRAVVRVEGAEEAKKTFDLRLDRDGQRVGLSTLFPGCFANLSIDTAQVEIPASTPPIGTQEGVVQSWSLSEVAPFEGFPHTISVADLPGEWTRASSDRDGTLFISRYRKKRSAGEFEENTRDVVFAGIGIESDIEQSVDFSFDLSDVGALYLNGNRLFQMNNGFRAKGAMFRGDFNRSAQVLSLPLIAGKNELIIAVAERANGWGLSGQFNLDHTFSITPIGQKSR